MRMIMAMMLVLMSACATETQDLTAGVDAADAALQATSLPTHVIGNIKLVYDSTCSWIVSGKNMQANCGSTFYYVNYARKTPQGDVWLFNAYRRQAPDSSHFAYSLKCASWYGGVACTRYPGAMEPWDGTSLQAEDTGAAGSASVDVGVQSEALLAEPVNACGRTLSAWQAFVRGTFGAKHGGGWNWTGQVSNSWTGNKTIGATNWHISCLNWNTDSYTALGGGYTSVQRKCTITNNNGYSTKFDVTGHSGHAVSGTPTQDFIYESQTAGTPWTGDRTLFLANPCN